MEKEIGSVTHYFGHLSVAALNLTDNISIGDMIHFKGRLTDFIQPVESMQIEHQSVQRAGPGDDVAIKVQDHVREHDTVFKII